MRVVIGSSEGFLALTRPDEDRVARTAVVEFETDDGLAARLTVHQHYASGFTDLADYFASLAADWKGWRGAREWRSLGGELRIRAVHDGHVRLDLELRGPIPQESEWRVQCQVVLEPGEQLSAAAADLREFARPYESTI